MDQSVVIPHGTGSSDNNYSLLAYDVSGNYFDLDMSLLEPGYMYGIKLSFYNEDVLEWVESPETFKFKVESR